MDGRALDGLDCSDGCHEWIVDMNDVYRCSREGCSVSLTVAEVGDQAAVRDLDLIYYDKMESR